MSTLDKIPRNMHIEILYNQIMKSVNNLSDDIRIGYDGTEYESAGAAVRAQAFKDYVTPEMFGAKGDGIVDDTIALQTALNDGRTVVGIGDYRITSMVFVNHQYKANANSKIILDFDGTCGVVIGGDQIAYDNTQYNFDVDMAIDCNNRTFSKSCVALNAIKRSCIKLRGLNCRGVFYKDVYGNNGSNYENYIDINAIGSNTVGSVCALLQSSDNNYNQIISRDFETCVLMNSDSTQNINCIHGWLSTNDLWENSKLIAVVKNNDNVVVPRLKFNFIYQDTMRYGFYIGENRIEAFGGLWFSAVNSGIVSTATIEGNGGFPIISFYGENINAPSFIKADFYDFFSRRMSFNDKRALVFNGEINPHRTGYLYSDADAIPMGNVAVALSPNAVNSPMLNDESTLIQFNSLRQTVQFITTSDKKIYMRKKNTWLADKEKQENETAQVIDNWSNWEEIYVGFIQSSEISEVLTG